MKAIKAQLEFVEEKAEVVAKPTGEMVIELNDLELALVGGGAVDFTF